MDNRIMEEMAPINHEDYSSLVFLVAMCVEVPSTTIKISDHLSSSNLTNRIVAISPSVSNASSSCVDSAFGPSPTSSSPSTPPPSQTQQSSNSKKTSFCSSAPTNLLKICYRIVRATKNDKGNAIISSNYFIDIDNENPMDKLNFLNHQIEEIINANLTENQSSHSRILLVASNEDIRQNLYPAVISNTTKTRENDEKNNFKFQMPLLFHNFVAFTTNFQFLKEPTLENKVDSIVNHLVKMEVSLLYDRIEAVSQYYIPAVCSDFFVDSTFVARVRGLPWQVSDQDIALFFAGLNIAPGGIALCLSAEGRPDCGRRNGEALVRFESHEHRELALQRHRKFLNNRYIEVYRGSGEDFIKVAVGADSEAVRFVSRDAAMIIRMRGLPFQTNEQQIHEFFSNEGEENCGIVEHGGILFVNRPDGRPSGDAFVLFADENSGRKALTKHKNRIGTRYIELFRTTQAEVQQLFNRTIKSPQTFTPILTPKRDCIRLRGLPYEAQVQQVVDFMENYARNIVFQGVHMIYNNLGHPSGEAFIQLDSENAAASAAQSMHNKYMEMGKKKRYIEVFQCSPEDMNLLLSTPLIPQRGSPTGLSPLTKIPPNILPAGILPSNGLIPLNSSQQFRVPSNAFSLFNQMSHSPNHNSQTQQTTLNFAANGGNLCFPLFTAPPPPMLQADLLYNPQFQQIPFFHDGGATLMQSQEHTNLMPLILQQQQGPFFSTNLAPPLTKNNNTFLDLSAAAQQAHARQFALIHT